MSWPSKPLKHTNTHTQKHPYSTEAEQSLHSNQKQVKREADNKEAEVKEEEEEEEKNLWPMRRI